MRRREVLFLLVSVSVAELSYTDRGMGESLMNQSGSRSMFGAIMHGDTDAVKALADQGANLNERSQEDQSTPMIRAAQIDRWPMVEILLDHGADIWAHNEFGITAAQRTITSRILAGSNEDGARLRVIEKLKARGYPFPPPDRAAVLALDKAGKWPPHVGAN